MPANTNTGSEPLEVPFGGSGLKDFLDVNTVLWKHLCQFINHGAIGYLEIPILPD